jgi:hypothetical protein
MSATTEKRYIVKPNEPAHLVLEAYSHVVWDTQENKPIAYAGPFTAVEYAAQMNEKGFIEP